MIEGTLYEAAPVTSGVPQGSVLGPLLFLCYINDLPACVSSHIRLFADDCLLYRTINAQHDTVILQEDLNILQQWEAKWLMSFNPDKCEVLRVTNKRKHIFFFFIFSHFYVGSMCLMRRLHLGRSCASSSDNPLSNVNTYYTHNTRYMTGSSTQLTKLNT